MEPPSNPALDELRSILENERLGSGGSGQTDIDIKPELLDEVARPGGRAKHRNSGAPEYAFDGAPSLPARWTYPHLTTPEVRPIPIIFS